MVTTPTIHVTRDRYHLAWDPAIEPIATIDSGGTVEFDLLDASCGQLDADCGRLENVRRIVDEAEKQGKLDED